MYRDVKMKRHINFCTLIIGPSGVRALPLAAGINEGGHYCQAQLQLAISLEIELR
jgi:hypothetical protein